MRSGIIRAAYVYPYAFHYRNAFHDELRSLLRARGIEYDFIYCGDPQFDSPRGDLVAPPWAASVRCTAVRVGRFTARYQHALRLALSKDLIILQQENALLLNYLIQAIAPLLGKRVAFFGHGRNFQSRRPDGPSERLKGFMARRVNWWFAYTERCADVVAGYGFPRDRITVFNNAIDASIITQQRRDLSQELLEATRRDLVGGSHNVAVYVGGIYPDKRIEFLVESAVLIRQQLPDFHLVIIGGGRDAHLAKAAAERHPWIKYLGPKFGAEKTLIVSLGRVLLMPGLVGLAVLDSFAYGTPIITTDYPYHSPEIDYLRNGENGLITDNTIESFAGAAIRLLTNEPLRHKLVEQGGRDLNLYTIPNMAKRFADGIAAALK